MSAQFSSLRNLFQILQRILCFNAFIGFINNLCSLAKLYPSIASCSITLQDKLAIIDNKINTIANNIQIINSLSELQSTGFNISREFQIRNLLLLAFNIQQSQRKMPFTIPFKQN